MVDFDFIDETCGSKERLKNVFIFYNFNVVILLNHFKNNHCLYELRYSEHNLKWMILLFFIYFIISVFKYISIKLSYISTTHIKKEYQQTHKTKIL